MKCSTRKAPTGTIPLRECRGRRRKEDPLPRPNGATPRFTAIGAAAVVATMTAPYGFKFEKRTFYYPGHSSSKSRTDHTPRHPLSHARSRQNVCGEIEILHDVGCFIGAVSRGERSCTPGTRAFTTSREHPTTPGIGGTPRRG